MKPYYEDQWVTLYCGDSREIVPQVDGWDAVVTDPPYGVQFGGKNTKWTTRRDEDYMAVEDGPEYLDAVVIPLLAGIIDTGARVVITPGVRNLFRYPKPAAVGSIFYPSGAGLGKWGFTCSQPILYYGSDPYLSTGKGHRPDSFSTTEAAEENGHPCPKPIGTMKWLVNKAALPGETVLDPFAGSGTTLRAAKDLGRKAVGVEISERYCEIAAKRMGQEVLDLGMAA